MPAPASPVPSPCNSVCRMNAVTGWCEGCYRTLDEIAAWARMEEHEKQAVWQRLELRRRHDDPSSDEYIGRSPGGTRAG